MEQIRKSPPWETYFNEIAALFANDKGVKVEKDFADGRYVIHLYVEGAAKADALARLLPDEKVFGDIIVSLVVHPANAVEDVGSLLRAAFEGNEDVVTIAEERMPDGSKVRYVVLNGSICQFFDDNLTSYSGQTTMLLQDVARDVFDPIDGTFFCTVRMD